MEKAILLHKTVRRGAGRTVAVDVGRLREIKNHRRVQLIRKSAFTALGAGEAAELARLQSDCIADAEHDFPLPWARLERAEKAVADTDTEG